ncbi:hypothetical protein G6F46_004207 [Rhizopus delemar]|uniref:CHCH domain-containing protein n=3 Tax=Rhizopus TaxID=4842 RepID=I1BN75_RHIO9|nr:hypothetical protein RO3G_02359 [Rhizopus delemar RA 99-880]KAG1051862.1 hypothetical protein G6F43_005963 [Rhizopus delemar]KAG1548090.1 hypothetical protein G6F51_003873 [Rhizopus arrhizus]KAG1459439.1 hypothetical protein G6F55_004759 [Rhizopus delemar]KAG1500751.1 hypothetical protein G6F54_003508 [Rhizopus delemar]|eukprot:EIE77655.1 hypothetical protein RO3G_02359 [Rhizopus delemar RA 99-880]
MPRQTRRSAPAQQTRQAHTMPVRQAPPPAAPASRPAPAAAPPAAQPQHAMTPAPAAAPPSLAQAAPQQPGLFAQMATTAAGVAVGSAVGHTLANGVSSIFSGSGSSEPQQAQAQPQAQYQPQQYQAAAPQANSCEADAKAFTNCLEATNNDMSSCQWYLEALKSCQAMASNY